MMNSLAVGNKGLIIGFCVCGWKITSVLLQSKKKNQNKKPTQCEHWTMLWVCKNPRGECNPVWSCTMELHGINSCRRRHFSCSGAQVSLRLTHSQCLPRCLRSDRNHWVFVAWDLLFSDFTYRVLMDFYSQIILCIVFHFAAWGWWDMYSQIIQIFLCSILQHICCKF